MHKHHQISEFETLWQLNQAPLICSHHSQPVIRDAVLGLFDVLDLLMQSLLRHVKWLRCCKHNHPQFLHFPDPTTLLSPLFDMSLLCPVTQFHRPVPAQCAEFPRTIQFAVESVVVVLQAQISRIFGIWDLITAIFVECRRRWKSDTSGFVIVKWKNRLEGSGRVIQIG